MWIAHDYRVARRSAGTAVAIGNFDGVHLGHRELLRRACEGAEAHGVDPVVLTFEPHPTRILAPERAAPLLTGLDRKVELLAHAGIKCVVLQGFDRAFSSQSPEAFAREVLRGLRAREVYVGENFRFGRDRKGDGALLAELGPSLGFRAHVITSVASGDETISSSRVRAALAAGDLALAEALLGRRFDVDGLVVEGDQRGRTLGFPTANLRTPVEALPRDGVYAVRARVLGEEDTGFLPAVANLGVRPTFDAGRSLEVHLLEGGRELYGRTLRVEFVARVRDERRFDGLDALRAQITEDTHSARTLLRAAEGP